MSERLVIRIDQTGPVILYDPDGDENLSKSIAARVTVLDDASGIDHSELDYVWSTSEVQLDEHANWQPFTNNSTLSHTDKNGGDWYLHIRAKDEAGNESYGISKRFRLEQEPDKPADPEPPKQPNQPDRSVVRPDLHIANQTMPD